VVRIDPNAYDPLDAFANQEIVASDGDFHPSGPWDLDFDPLGQLFVVNAKDWNGAIVFLELSDKARSKIGAENFDLLYNIGVAHYQLGRADDSPDELANAVAWYQKALEVEIDEPTTMYNIVVAYVVGKEWMQAITWGEKYVSVQDDDPNGWRLLSRSYTEMGEDSKARQCAARYEELLRDQ
jgi:tetratricopeptide (TPR) repeat protein